MTLLHRGTSGGVGRGRRPLLAPVLTGLPAALMALTGCAVGADAPTTSPTPEPGLAAEAVVGSTNAGRTSAGEGRGGERAGDRDGRGAGRSSEGAGESDGGPTGTTDPGAATSGATSPAAPAGWQRLVSVADPAGDQGAAPAYGDVRSVALDSDGESLRMAVTMAGVVPGRLARGEVQGVGIDFYTADEAESDHQVFLDGGSDGWVAYLQTPRGFVPFPGELRLDGPTLTAVVPWSAVGEPAGATVAVFADWSSRVRAGSDTIDRTPVDAR